MPYKGVSFARSLQKLLGLKESYTIGQCFQKIWKISSRFSGVMRITVEDVWLLLDIQRTLKAKLMRLIWKNFRMCKNMLEVLYDLSSLMGLLCLSAIRHALSLSIILWYFAQALELRRIWYFWIEESS